MVSGPAASASFGNLLGVGILGPISDLVNLELGWMESSYLLRGAVPVIPKQVQEPLASKPLWAVFPTDTTHNRQVLTLFCLPLVCLERSF